MSALQEQALRQLLQSNFLELDFHHRAGAELEGEDAGGIKSLGVVVDELRRLLTVDLEENTVTAGDDVVVVPLARFFDGVLGVKVPAMVKGPSTSSPGLNFGTVSVRLVSAQLSGEDWARETKSQSGACPG